MKQFHPFFSPLQHAASGLIQCKCLNSALRTPLHFKLSSECFMLSLNAALAFINFFVQEINTISSMLAV